jgi:hypothetical protein
MPRLRRREKQRRSYGPLTETAKHFLLFGKRLEIGHPVACGCRDCDDEAMFYFFGDANYQGAWDSHREELLREYRRKHGPGAQPYCLDAELVR